MNDRLAGTIAYLGPHGQTGRESFEMIRHAGGSTLRAFCEMDDLGLSRDVTMALDVRSWPRDAFVRIIRDGQVCATTLFTVADDAIRCDGWIDGVGRVAQRHPLAAPLRYLGLHPLVGDALIAGVRGTDRPGAFDAIAGMTNSLAPAGDNGLVAVPVTIDVAYQGEEAITVSAGSFPAHRYALRWQPDWPVASLWVHRDEAFFLRLEWSMNASRYELAELRRTID